ncbi:hypothetical protein R2B38_01920 [Streptomyces sp. N50]|nr:hypothetical protein [Streptomyces sp. N50]WOX07694.1 hypothetical protein R2B38_01920 [Streptomyces sp. N50]
MHDDRPAHLRQGVRDGQPQGLEPPGGQRTAGGHMLLDRRALDELADDIRVLSGQIGVEDACRGEFTDPARRAELPAYAGERDLVVLRAGQQELHHDLLPQPVPGEPHHSLSAPAELTLADVSARQASWRGTEVSGIGAVPMDDGTVDPATRYDPRGYGGSAMSGRSCLPPRAPGRGRIKPGHRSRHNLSP